MCKRNVPVRNVVEKMYFFFLEKESGRNGMDGGVAPAFVEETAVLVEGLEEINVGFGSQPF